MNEKDEIIDELSVKLDRSEQYSRRNNVRITGIPETKGENTDKLILDLAKSIGENLSPGDIDVSHRVPRYPPSSQTQSRPIIVMFVSNASKRSLMSQRSKLKHVSKGNRVFINEDLTRTWAKLAKEARGLVKEKRVESSWVTGGVIIIKMKDGRLKKVSTNYHLQEVCEETRSKMVISLSQDQ